MKPVFLLFLALTVSAHGQSADTAPSPQPAAGKFNSTLLGGSAPVLNDEERAGIEITEAWKNKSLETMAGRAGANASPEFRFGESLPSIVCAILQVTDIELEPGEVVTHVNLGDSTRWTVERAQSGSGAGQVEHLIVKPRDVGLSTSLVVTTDRRTYHLLLVSDDKDFMHDVTFLYADAPAAASSAPVASVTPAPSATPTPPATPDPSPAPRPSRPKRHTDGKQVQVAEKNNDPPDDADEDYAVNGRADWKPISVYNKDGKTYIEMPASVKHKEAPVLFEEKKSGWFHTDKALVNYRVHGRWMVVDTVLDKAVLVSGVGSVQKRVQITHVTPKAEKSNVQ